MNRSQTRKTGQGRRLVPTAPAVLVATVALLAAAWWVARGVEADLTVRAQAALGAAGLPVAVEYDGRDARLSGTLAAPAAAARAAAAVAGVRGTRSVNSEIRVDPPAPASPAPATSTPGPGSSPGSGATPEAPVPPLPPATVRFDDASSALSPAALATLDAVVDHLLAYPEVRVVVEGHTDSTGTPESNLRLSRQRAEAVQDHLVSRGVPADRTEIAVFADARPVAGDDTADGRAANRRVEIVAVGP
jgi:outer membrane protein OmpA-like peptidoglycan-associated protein